MITSAILICIAAALWAVASHYTFQNRVKNKYSFWGGESWKRKYKPSSISDSKYYLMAAPENWYYRLFKIKYKERFPLSATVLVAFTDGYHLVQWAMTKCIIGAITLELRSFLALWALWLLWFNIVYLWKKKF